MKSLIVFDLDGTLAASKSALDAEMASLLHGLLSVVFACSSDDRQMRTFEEPGAIVSSAVLEQNRTAFISLLKETISRCANSWRQWRFWPLWSYPQRCPFTFATGYAIWCK